MSETKVLIISEDSFEDVVLLINGKRYSYYNVDPFNLRKIKGCIKYKNWGTLFPLLKKFSKGEHHE